MLHCFLSHVALTAINGRIIGMSAAVVKLLAGKGSEIGDFLTQHPAVNCISFTGGDTGISVSKKVRCFASSSGSLMNCAHIL